MARRKTDPPKDLIPRARTKPLTSEQLETFVSAYRDTFDGTTAARVAGYEEPHKIWPALLEKNEVQERLRGYELGVDAPASSASGILRYLQSQIFEAGEPVVTRDIVTGAPRVDITARVGQDPFVEYEQTVEDRGGITVRKTRIRKSDPSRLLQILTQNFEHLQRATGYEEDSLAQAIREMSKRGGSLAPMRKSKQQRTETQHEET